MVIKCLVFVILDFLLSLFEIIKDEIFSNQAFKKEISSRNVKGKLLLYAFLFINLMTIVIVCL